MLKGSYLSKGCLVLTSPEPKGAPMKSSGRESHVHIPPTEHLRAQRMLEMSKYPSRSTGFIAGELGCINADFDLQPTVERPRKGAALGGHNAAPSGRPHSHPRWHLLLQLLGLLSSFSPYFSLMPLVVCRRSYEIVIYISGRK